MTPADRAAIPEQWIRDYVDQLLGIGMKLDDGPMKAATLLRAEHAMDLVRAWREAKARGWTADERS